MILVYAGRRAQTLDGADERVEQRLRRLLTALRPRAVVGAAADGGDLLVLEAALSAGEPPEAHLVLPTAPDVFAQASVEEAWRGRHQRVLDRVAEAGGAVESLGLPDGEEAYRAANRTMLERAEQLRASAGIDGERVVALIVAAEGEGEMIEDLSAHARACCNALFSR